MMSTVHQVHLGVDILRLVPIGNPERAHGRGYDTVQLHQCGNGRSDGGVSALEGVEVTRFLAVHHTRIIHTAPLRKLRWHSFFVVFYSLPTHKRKTICNVPQSS